MNLFRKATLGVAGLALTIGGLTMVTVVEANAAAPCAAENQAAGAARNDAAHQANAYQRAKKKLKKAKRAYKRHHTSANKKKVKKARKAKKRAYARYRAANARYAAAASRADHCQAPPTRPAPAPAPATPDQVFDRFLSLLDPSALDQGGQSLADGVRTAADALAGSGLPIEQLQPVIARLADAIEQGSADPSQIPAIAQQFAGALQGGLDPNALADLLQGGLDPAQLASLLQQLGDAAEQSGVPISGVLDSVQSAIADFTAGKTPTDPQGLVTYILDKVQQGAVGTPLEDPVAQLVTTVEGALSSILGGLLGGLPGL